MGLRLQLCKCKILKLVYEMWMRRKFKLILFVWILRVIMSVLSYQKRSLRILNIIKKSWTLWLTLIGKWFHKPSIRDYNNGDYLIVGAIWSSGLELSLLKIRISTHLLQFQRVFSHREAYRLYRIRYWKVEVWAFISCLSSLLRDVIKIDLSSQLYDFVISHVVYIGMR